MTKTNKPNFSDRRRLQRMMRTSDVSGQANGKQALKSATTRTQIVDAAIHCLVDHGYANTTTPRIAEVAGVSRGAMMHHFSNRLNVIQAAIEHLHKKRLVAFRRAAVGAPAPAGPNRIHAALIGYWQHVTHPLFVAFHELTVASRTDPELERILRTARQAFYREWYRLAVDVFPEWQADQKNFNLALSLTQNLLEGMAITQLAGELDEKTRDNLLEYLEAQLNILLPEKPAT